MKKIISVLLIAALVSVFLPACGTGTDDGICRIAIVQQLSHSSLDEIRDAVQVRLEEIAAEKGMTIQVKTFNGQNDPTVLNQIGAQAVADGYDAIIPIASVAAQCMITAADGMEIPIIYAAVSDPVSAGLTDIPNVTGTSDALNTALIVDMMLTLNPDIRTVGLLYSNSEPNSEQPIAQAEILLKEKGISILSKTGNTADEILAAAGTLVGRADAVFTPTDNAVMNVAGAVAEILRDAGIPYYAGADSFVTAGAFATCGINYTALGTCTADMAMELLENGTCPAFRTMEGGIIAVNTDTASALNLDYTPLQSMASALKEVTTE